MECPTARVPCCEVPTRAGALLDNRNRHAVELFPNHRDDDGTELRMAGNRVIGGPDSLCVRIA